MVPNQATSTETTFEKRTSVSTNINASAATIMQLLTDARQFPEWNSTIVSLEGDIRRGEVIKLVSQLDPKRTFKLTVAELTPTTLIWKDGFAPMFSGVRTFSLASKPDGTTDFTMTEVLKGLMLPLIKGSLPDFKPNFEQYAADLKKAAEHAV